MTSDIQSLIPGYLQSRKDILKKILELKAEQDRIHHQLRTSLMENIDEFPMWMHDEVEKYVAADKIARRDFLDALVERMRYVESSPVTDKFMRVLQQGARSEGQISLDLTTWISMRNSISFAITALMKYASGYDLEDADNIMREAKSYEKNRNKPIDYIEDLAVSFLESTIILERPNENEVITISITEFSKRQQEIIHLLVDEGKSYSQIAEELGISKDSVAEHIKMARKKAQKLKEKHGVQQAFRGAINEAPIVTAKSRLTMNRPKKITVKVGEQLTIEV